MAFFKLAMKGRMLFTPRGLSVSPLSMRFERNHYNDNEDVVHNLLVRIHFKIKDTPFEAHISSTKHVKMVGWMEHRE